MVKKDLHHVLLAASQGGSKNDDFKRITKANAQGTRNVKSLSGVAKCEEQNKLILRDKLLKTQITVLLAVFGRALDFYKYTLDALQAKRPFYKYLFQSYMREFHLLFTEYIAVFWNYRKKRI